MSPSIPLHLLAGVKCPSPQGKLAWGVLGARTCWETRRASTPASPAVLSWPGWGTPLLRAPLTLRGLPSVRDHRVGEGKGFRASGGYVNPLEKPRTGELSKQDTKLEPRAILGRRSRKGFHFSSCAEKTGLSWVKGQRSGGFKFSSMIGSGLSPRDLVSLPVPCLHQDTDQDLVLNITNTRLLTPCVSPPEKQNQ